MYIYNNKIKFTLKKYIKTNRILSYEFEFTFNNIMNYNNSNIITLWIIIFNTLIQFKYEFVLNSFLTLSVVLPPFAAHPDIIVAIKSRPPRYYCCHEMTLPPQVLLPPFDEYISLYAQRASSAMLALRVLDSFH